MLAYELKKSGVYVPSKPPIGIVRNDLKPDRGFEADRLVVSQYALRRFQRERGVRSAFVITEFDFEHIRGEWFHNGADLAAYQSAFGQVVRQGDDVEYLDTPNPHDFTPL